MLLRALNDILSTEIQLLQLGLLFQLFSPNLTLSLFHLSQFLSSLLVNTPFSVKELLLGQRHSTLL